MYYTMFTDQGCREYNEDNYGMEIHGESRCFVLADGLGGHGGGDVASEAAVTAVCKIFRSEGYTDTFFEKACQTAQEAILAEQEKANNYNGMKTTLVILVLADGFAYYAHVGDSRLYFLNEGHIKERTYDHSVPQMLALSKEIKEKEIRHHPDRSKLLRVLGVKDDSPKCDVSKPIKLRGNLSFLLCSDGFWELVEDKDIETTNRAAADTEEWMDTLSAMVRTNGEGVDMDNYSAIAVWVEDGDTTIENREDIRKKEAFKVEFEEPGIPNSVKRKNKKKLKLEKKKNKKNKKIKDENDTETLVEEDSETLCERSLGTDTLEEDETVIETNDSSLE